VLCSIDCCVGVSIVYVVCSTIPFAMVWLNCHVLPLPLSGAWRGSGRFFVSRMFNMFIFCRVLLRRGDYVCPSGIAGLLNPRFRLCVGLHEIGGLRIQGI
jgi:hypothetical protein